MQDPNVSDILVNDPYNVYVERNGRLELTDRIFADEDHLMRIIQRIVGRLGRRIDEMSPMVDARLPDGSRVNAIIPPLAINGPTLSIRRFGVNALQMDDLLANGSLTPEMAEVSRRRGEGPASPAWSRAAPAPARPPCLNVLSTFIPESRTHDHHRRFGGTEVPAAALGAAGSAAAQCRRGGRSDASATWSATACACVPTGSSWAKCAARKSGTCCRP